MKSLLYGAAAVFTIIAVVFSVWWTFVTAAYNDQHKIIAFVLTASVVLCIILYCVIFAGLVNRANLPTTRSAEDNSQTAAKHIYIGPGGVPVSIENGKIKVDLKFFSSASVRLLHVKAYVGTSPVYATLSDGEPDEIRAGDVFTKILEEKLESGMRSSLLMQREMGPIHVQGAAKFSDATDDQKFHFDAVPFFLRRD